MKPDPKEGEKDTAGGGRGRAGRSGPGLRAAAAPGQASLAAAAAGLPHRPIHLTRRAARLGPPWRQQPSAQPQGVLETGRSFPGALFFGQNVINNEYEV